MSTPIHRRTYDCEAFDEGDGRLRVRGRLVDNRPQGLGIEDGEPLTIHDMVIDLMVSVADFTLVDVETKMNVHPYLACPNVLPDYRKLIGLSISRGYSRKVRELYGGPNGCSHIGALLQALGPVAIQASWSLLGGQDDLATRIESDNDPESQARRARLNADTCHVWVSGGEHLTSVELGRSSMRPDWENERLRKLGVEVD